MVSKQGLGLGAGLGSGRGAGVGTGLGTGLGVGLGVGLGAGLGAGLGTAKGTSNSTQEHIDVDIDSVGNDNVRHIKKRKTNPTEKRNHLVSLITIILTIIVFNKSITYCSYTSYSSKYHFIRGK